MPARSKSTSAIWLVCIAIGLLFLTRGAFLPYAFPLFQHLGNLSYVQIAFLIPGYMFAQSICAPLAGWYTDRTSARIALTTTICLGLCSFLVISTRPGFVISTAAVFVAGLAFVLGKIALNTILVIHSTADVLRKSVAKRATLLNTGSFIGNTIAFQMTTRVGYGPLAVALGLLHLPLAIGLAPAPAPSVAHPKNSLGAANVRALCKNKLFLSDGLRRFALVLPYGCWGTIIPKYVIDQYHSNEKVWIVYLTSLITTLIGAHFLAVYMSAKLYKWGFKWEWWSVVSVLLYCAGLLLLIFARHPIMLPVAIAIFICGEVLMTPCLDETAKRHSSDAAMGSCLGLLNLLDGFGRMLGAAFALAMYGWMRHSRYETWYWPIVVGVFLLACSALHVVAYAMARPRELAGFEGCPPREAVTSGEAQVLA
ncbi:MAG TPA: MFS transporter [Tepidisphaeraceae bacterium]|nr:MFS transporter [Tepidisphaeraceae bacterium]